MAMYSSNAYCCYFRFSLVVAIAIADGFFSASRFGSIDKTSK